jgi:hypothetical protein
MIFGVKLCSFDLQKSPPKLRYHGLFYAFLQENWRKMYFLWSKTTKNTGIAQKNAKTV